MLFDMLIKLCRQLFVPKAIFDVASLYSRLFVLSATRLPIVIKQKIEGFSAKKQRVARRAAYATHKYGHSSMR